MVNFFFVCYCNLTSLSIILGEEYVQKVMYERSKCDPWVRVEVDDSKIGEQTVKVETVMKLLLPDHLVSQYPV